MRWEIIYGIISIAVLVTLGIQSDFPSGYLVAKPLLMLTLIISWMIMKSGFWKTAFFYALIASWLGDILLLKGDDLFMFTLGLAAFLISHLFYIRAFLLQRRSGSLNLRRDWVLLIPIIYGITYLIYAWPYLNGFEIPVTAYVIVISSMFITAYLRRGSPGISYNLVLIGAILFMISDSVLAYDTFIEVLKPAPYIVMITYICAQYLIFKGYKASSEK